MKAKAQNIGDLSGFFEDKPPAKVVVVVKQDPYTRFIAKFLLLAVPVALIVWWGWSQIQQIEMGR